MKLLILLQVTRKGIIQHYGKTKCINIKHKCPLPNCHNPILLPGKCCKTCQGQGNSIYISFRFTKLVNCCLFYTLWAISMKFLCLLIEFCYLGGVIVIMLSAGSCRSWIRSTIGWNHRLNNWNMLILCYMYAWCITK